MHSATVALPFLLLVLISHCSPPVLGAPNVVQNGLNCPAANSPTYHSFAYSEERESNLFTTQLLAISMVEKSGRVSRVISLNVPFDFGTKPQPQYIKDFVEPIMGDKATVSKLAALVGGSEIGFPGPRSRLIKVDCAQKNNASLPSIELTVGVNGQTANLVMKPSEYIIKHSPVQGGYCYLAFYYLTYNEFFRSTDFQARNFCVVVDTEAKTVGFARPVA